MTIPFNLNYPIERVKVRVANSNIKQALEETFGERMTRIEDGVKAMAAGTDNSNEIKKLKNSLVHETRRRDQALAIARQRLEELNELRASGRDLSTREAQERLREALEDLQECQKENEDSQTLIDQMKRLAEAVLKKRNDDADGLYDELENSNMKGYADYLLGLWKERRSIMEELDECAQENLRMRGNEGDDENGEDDSKSQIKQLQIRARSLEDKLVDARDDCNRRLNDMRSEHTRQLGEIKNQLEICKQRANNVNADGLADECEKCQIQAGLYELKYEEWRETLREKNQEIAKLYETERDLLDERDKLRRQANTLKERVDSLEKASREAKIAAADQARQQLQQVTAERDVSNEARRQLDAADARALKAEKKARVALDLVTEAQKQRNDCQEAYRKAQGYYFTSSEDGKEREEGKEGREEEKEGKAGEGFLVSDDAYVSFGSGDSNDSFGSGGSGGSNDADGSGGSGDADVSDGSNDADGSGGSGDYGGSGGSGEAKDGVPLPPPPPPPSNAEEELDAMMVEMYSQALVQRADQKYDKGPAQKRLKEYLNIKDRFKFGTEPLNQDNIKTFLDQEGPKVLKTNSGDITISLDGTKALATVQYVRHRLPEETLDNNQLYRLFNLALGRNPVSGTDSEGNVATGRSADPRTFPAPSRALTDEMLKTKAAFDLSDLFVWL